MAILVLSPLPPHNVNFLKSNFDFLLICQKIDINKCKLWGWTPPPLWKKFKFWFFLGGGRFPYWETLNFSMCAESSTHIINFPILVNFWICCASLALFFLHFWALFGTFSYFFVLFAKGGGGNPKASIFKRCVNSDMRLQNYGDFFTGICYSKFLDFKNKFWNSIFCCWNFCKKKFTFEEERGRK